MFLQRICERLGSLNDELSNYVYHSFCDTIQKVDVIYGSRKENGDESSVVKLICYYLNGKESAIPAALPNADILDQEDITVTLKETETETIFERQVRTTSIIYRKYFLYPIAPYHKHAIFTECARMTKPALLLGTAVALLAMYNKSLAYTVALAVAFIGVRQLTDRIDKRADRIKSNPPFSFSLARVIEEERDGYAWEAFLNADGSVKKSTQTIGSRNISSPPVEERKHPETKRD